MKPNDTEALFRDGKHYDALNTIDHDLPFWLEYAAGSVLELACGTGRITIPAALKLMSSPNASMEHSPRRIGDPNIPQSGGSIKGVDISKGMLERAKEKAAAANVDIDFIHSDFRSIDLGEKFDAILCPFNSFHHIHDLESLLAFFNVVKIHLKPEGKFVFDIFNPDLNLLLNNDIDFAAREYENPYTPGEKVLMKDKRNYDKVTQINHITRHYKIDGGEKDFMLNMRVYFPSEIDNYLLMNGFEIINKFGSFTKEEFNAESGKQIFICGLRL